MTMVVHHNQEFEEWLALKCKKCQDIILSRHRHDWVPCSCGKVYIDGGREYVRYGGDEKFMEIVKIRVTKDELRPTL